MLTNEKGEFIMIKKIKAIFVLFLLIGMVLFPLKEVNAHSVELDPESLISLPWFITNGSGEITIKNSVTGYSLYYQAVQISNEDYSQMEKINSDGEIALDTLKGEYENLEAEVENLKEISDNAYNEYQEGKDGDDEDALKNAYETAI